MNLNVQSLVSTMAEEQAELNKMKGDLARCQNIVATASNQDEAIAKLRMKRSQELANALIDQRAANTVEIDTEIAKLQKASAKAQLDSEAASTGIPILQGRIATAATRLAETREQLSQAVTEDIVAQHDQALEKYFAAVDSLSAVVEEIVACELTWRHIFNAGNQEKFPGRGKAILDDVRTGGLRVRWDYSMLRDPKVANGYVPGFEETYFLPWWADERNTQFAVLRVAEKIKNLKADGYPTADYVKKSESIESRTVVEVIRGNIHSPVQKIDAATGKSVIVDDRYFGPGESLAMGESEAASLVLRGLVKFVDGRTKQDAHEISYPGEAMPAHVQNSDLPGSVDLSPRARAGEVG